MQIKPYPEFQPLEKEYKPIFDDLFLRFPPQISEFTFTNLYSWRKIYNLSLAKLGDFIILRSGKDNQKRYFMPLGEGSIKTVIAQILKEINAIFIRIPERVAGLFSTSNDFKVEPDRDNFDYLFKTEELIALKGRKYDGKRNLINKFKSMYKYEYQKLDHSNIKECLDFEERWCTVKNCDSIEGLNNERQAIQEMMDNCSDFGLIAGAIKVDGKTCALAISEKLNKNTLVFHILKADPGMPGLYQTITNEFLKHEAGDFEYVNFEQDLGVSGLRKAKLSYNPVELIKKFTLSPVV